MPVSELCAHVDLPLLDPKIVYGDNLCVRETHNFY